MVLLLSVGEAEVPPQLITLARGISIGTFSIFIMVEIRRSTTKTSSALTLNPLEMLWYLAPTTSVFALWLLSDSLNISTQLWLILGAFYLIQLIVQLIRSNRGELRSGVWEIAPPILLAVLMLRDWLSWVGLALGGGFLLFAMAKRGPARHGVTDSLVIQLPSLCIAPVITILLRDSVETISVLSRGHLEAVGMIINGCGGALWTAIVMQSQRLVFFSIAATLGGILTACVLAFGPAIDSPVISAVGALLALEMLRGSLWLGVTGILIGVGRWRGFIISAISTAFPVIALVASRNITTDQYVLGLYAALHILVPVAVIVLWKYGKPNPVSASKDIIKYNAGEKCAKQSLVICIGAQKAGTTTLYELMRMHPEVIVSKRKETGFFYRAIFNSGGSIKYRSLFPSPVAEEKIIFEADPNYMFISRAIARIYAHDQSARLIVLLRNPVLRAYSQYKMMYEAGYEDQSFERALELERTFKRKSPRDIETRHYFARSCYAKQIAFVLKQFPREQVLFVVFENFVKNQNEEFNKILKWMGISEFASDRIVAERPHFDFNPLRRHLFKPYINLFFNILKGAHVYFFNVADHPKTNQSTPDLPVNSLSPDFYEELFNFFEDDIRCVEAMTCLDLSIWKART